MDPGLDGVTQLLIIPCLPASPATPAQAGIDLTAGRTFARAARRERPLKISRLENYGSRPAPGWREDALRTAVVFTRGQLDYSILRRGAIYDWGCRDSFTSSKTGIQDPSGSAVALGPRFSRGRRKSTEIACLIRVRRSTLPGRGSAAQTVVDRPAESTLGDRHHRYPG